MPKKIFFLILFFLGLTLVAAGCDFSKTKKTTTSQETINANQQLDGILIEDWKQLTRYYCEQSGGKFQDNICLCPSEFGADMYDKRTGQCQTTTGGPDGELGKAMAECLGLRLSLDECVKNKDLLKEKNNQ